MAEAQKKKLDEQQEDAGDGEEESGVAEVRDADGGLGGWRAFSVGKERGLVLGTDWGPEDGHGDGWFF
jgi:hypothetical protein